MLTYSFIAMLLTIQASLSPQRILMKLRNVTHSSSVSVILQFKITPLIFFIQFRGIAIIFILHQPKINFQSQRYPSIATAQADDLQRDSLLQQLICYIQTFTPFDYIKWRRGLWPWLRRQNDSATIFLCLNLISYSLLKNQYFLDILTGQYFLKSPCYDSKVTSFKFLSIKVKMSFNNYALLQVYLNSISWLVIMDLSLLMTFFFLLQFQG